MNERIRQLAEQAKKYALDAMIKITDKEQALKVYSESYDTKFAELIIQECIGVLSLTKDGKMKMNLNGHMLKLVEGIGKAYSTGIKEHFYGVEE
jgi:hypothetical protein